MALIRKYITGGSFRDYVNERLLNGEDLTTKSYPYINDALSTFDPNATYGEEVGKNWAGKYKIDSPEAANTYLANLYKEYQQAAPKQTTIAPEGGWGPVDRSVGSLMDYIAKSDYAGNEDYALKQLARMENNEQVKKYLVDRARKLADEYATTAEGNPTDNWKDLDTVRTVRDILSSINTDSDKISDEDWEKVVSFTDKLGWQLNDFLIPDETLEQRKQEAAAKQEREKLNNIIETYKSSGITNENIQGELYQSGYVKPAETLNQNIKDILSKKGYSIFSDEAGKNFAVLKGNEKVTGESGIVTDNPFSEDYGKTFSIVNGQLFIHDKGQKPQDLQLPEWEDEGNVRKELLTNIPSLSSHRILGSSADDYQGNYAKDALGRRDYTAKLTFIDKTNPNISFDVVRREDGKYYDKWGREFKVPKFTGYGEIVEPIRDIVGEYLNNQNTVFYGLEPKEGASIQEIESDIANLERKLVQYRSTGKLEDNKKKNREIAQKLAYLLKNASPEEFDKVDQLARRLQSLYATKVDPNAEKSDYIFQFKEGGVLKAQRGLSFAELAAQGGRRREVDTSSSSTGIRDVSNALENASTLQRASLIASAASFIPGAGAIGGAASTVLDAIEGSKDGWQKEDTLNLLGNIGFTALAAVGLGATKGAKMAVKAGKVAKTAKAADTAKDVSKTIEKATKVVNKLNKTGAITDDVADAANAAKRVAKAASAGKKIDPTDLQKVKELSKLKTTWVGAHAEGIGDTAKAAGTYMAKKAPAVGKIAKVGLVGQAGVTGATGLIDVGRNIAQEEGSLPEKIVKGIGSTDVDSLRKATQLGALSRIGYMNRKASKGIERTLKPVKGTKDRTIIKIGDKNIEVAGKVKTPSGKNPTSWLSGNEKNKRKFLEKLQSDKSISSKDKKAIKKVLKKDKIGKISAEFKRGVAEEYALGKKPSSPRYGDVKDWLRTQKVLERGELNYARLKRFPFWKGKEVISGTPETSIQSSVKEIQELIKNIPKKKQGGVLKLAIGDKLTLPDWLKKPVKLSFNMPKIGDNKDLAFKNPLSTEYSNYTPYENVNKALASLSSTSSIPGSSFKAKEDKSSEYTPEKIDEFEVVPYNPKKFRDYYPFFEGLKLAAINRANDESTKYQIRAALSLPQLVTAGRTYLPTSNTYTNLAYGQAGNLRGAGNRIASTTSDFDKSAAIRLSANKQAADTILQGQYQDIANNQNTALQQAKMDTEMAEYNRNIVNQYLQSAALARGNVDKLRANEAMMRGNNWGNFIGGTGTYLNRRPYKKAMWEYQQEAMNPNITNAQRYLAYLQTTGLEKAKKDYENYYSSVDNQFLDKPKFEDSSMYKSLQERISNTQNMLNNILSRYTTLGRAVQSVLPTYQRGGSLTLEERVLLENAKHNNRKSLKTYELFFKQLMKNNELVQKALIKVFK